MIITERDLSVWTRTVYGEARGESELGKLAVAYVIWNRCQKRKQTPVEVCLARWQFSCWNPDDPNFQQITNPKFDVSTKTYWECVEAVKKVLLNQEPDPTGGSDHYHTDYIRKPKWALNKEPVTKIGAHLFYNNIN